MIKYVCFKCGSDDIRRNADVIWNWEAQEWEIAAIFDKPITCERCGEETTLTEVVC